MRGSIVTAMANTENINNVINARFMMLLPNTSHLVATNVHGKPSTARATIAGNRSISQPTSQQLFQAVVRCPLSAQAPALAVRPAGNQGGCEAEAPLTLQRQFNAVRIV